MPADFQADLLTRGTIWIAMLGWSVGIILAGRRLSFATRFVWTVALGFYCFHIFLAYEHFYNHDHAVAWQATADDTEELIGVRSGFGLIVNFVFLLVLAFDVIVQWGKKKRFAGRVIDGLVVFMIVNGAIVFGDGAVRWYGSFLVLLMTAGWFLQFRRARIEK